MAMTWLDAACYADTDGFQADATRNNWPWRDWVVDAYNQNMPFDEKPSLTKWEGMELPASIRGGQRLTGMTAGKQ